MKSPRVLIALSVLLLAVGWVIWDRVHTFSPTAETTFSATPETESAFLKNYTPTNVMNRFNEGQGELAPFLGRREPLPNGVVDVHTSIESSREVVPQRAGPDQFGRFIIEIKRETFLSHS